MKPVVLFFLLFIWIEHVVAGERIPLTMGNVAVEFVSWAKATPTYSYQQLLPDADKKLQEFGSLGYGELSLLERSDLLLKRDGIVEETTTRVKLFVNSVGIESGGNLSFWVNAHLQTAQIQQAYVLDSDGSIVDVDPTTIQISSDNTDSIFTDSFWVTIPFQKLKPGAIAVLVVKKNHEKDKELLPWSQLYYPQTYDYRQEFQVNIRWEKGVDRPLMNTDLDKIACLSEVQSILCKGGPFPPLKIDPDMPNHENVLPQLIVAEAASSWETIKERMMKLTGVALSSNKEIEKKALSLTRDVHTPEDKLARIHEFVSRQIRYVGLELGHGGVKPRSTATTLTRRFGDCKDKTVLFVDLARQVGLDAYPVLTSTRRSNLNKILLPSSSYFNHMIACVSMENGEEKCIDLTDPNNSSDNFPYYLQGAVTLALDKKKQLDKLPSGKFTWSIGVTANNEMMADGRLIEKLNRAYSSNFAAHMREALASQTQEEREQWLLDGYQNVMSDKVTPIFSYKGVENQALPITIESTTIYDNVIDIEQFSGYTEVEAWLRKYLLQMKSKNINYNYHMYGINYQSSIGYQLPPGYKFESTGAELEYRASFGSMVRNYVVKGDTVVVNTKVEVPQVTIAVEDISRFNKFIDVIADQSEIRYRVLPVGSK